MEKRSSGTQQVRKHEDQSTRGDRSLADPQQQIQRCLCVSSVCLSWRLPQTLQAQFFPEMLVLLQKVCRTGCRGADYQGWLDLIKDTRDGVWARFPFYLPGMEVSHPHCH